MADLTDEQHQLLKFEEAHFRHTAVKEELIRDQFGISAARYYQQLLALVLSPSAVAGYPQLTKRVQDRTRRQTQARATRTP